MKRAMLTALAIAGAVLVETALGYVAPGPGRLVDPFLLVVVYCALSAGETAGTLAGVAAGWVQDVLFGGRVLGLVPLSKLALGYLVGLAGRRVLITGAAARALVVLLASFADGLLVPWLASVFLVEVSPVDALELVARSAATALAGGALFALADRRSRRSFA